MSLALPFNLKAVCVALQNWKWVIGGWLQLLAHGTIANKQGCADDPDLLQAVKPCLSFAGARRLGRVVTGGPFVSM